MRIKPPRLNIGDKIAVISPAGPVKKSKLLKGIKYLEHKGYNIRLGSSVKKKIGYLAGMDYERVDDLIESFKDEEIKAIFCSRGGYGTSRIINKIDYDIIRKNPKILVGYSDITALSLSILKNTGLVTFSGPMVAVDMSNGIDSYSEDYLWRNLTSDYPIGAINNPEGDSIKILKEGNAEGELIGGCLSILTKLIGTDYMPDFNGKVLFLEDLNEELYKIDFFFSHLKLSGILNNISGLILGKFNKCPPKYRKSTYFEIEDIFKYYIDDLNVPVVSNVAYGHVPVKLTLPIGIKIQINTSSDPILYINENTVS